MLRSRLRRHHDEGDAHKALNVLGSLWIFSGLLIWALVLLSAVWKPPAFETIMGALVIICGLAGFAALMLSYPQSHLPGTRCPRCGKVRREGKGGVVGEVFGVCSCP